MIQIHAWVKNSAYVKLEPSQGIQQLHRTFRLLKIPKEKKVGLKGASNYLECLRSAMYSFTNTVSNLSKTGIAQICKEHKTCKWQVEVTKSIHWISIKKTFSMQCLRCILQQKFPTAHWPNGRLVGGLGQYQITCNAADNNLWEWLLQIGRVCYHLLHYYAW